MAHVEFHDFSTQVINTFEDTAIAFLEEVGSTLQQQAADNTRRKSGNTAGAWAYIVDDGAKKCTVGNPLQNAIWEEFGKKVLCRIKIGQNRFVIL